MRLCKIIDATVTAEDGGSDGAYDLFGETGDADHVGKAIADSLKSVDMFSASNGDQIAECGNSVCVTVTIRVSGPNWHGDESVWE